MGPLVTTLTTLVLLGGFVVMTTVERKRGQRVSEERRLRFDHFVARMAFIVEHVDFAAFVRDSLADLVRRLGHESVHLSLQLVRAVERGLTRVVRTFRAQQATLAPRETAREFVRSLSDLKEQLKAAPPEIPEIQ